MPPQNSDVDLNPQKLVAKANRREGVYNRAGEPSVTFSRKEEQWRERALIFVKKSEQAIQSLLRCGWAGRIRTCGMRESKSRALPLG